MFVSSPPGRKLPESGNLVSHVQASPPLGVGSYFLNGAVPELTDAEGAMLTQGDKSCTEPRVTRQSPPPTNLVSLLKG